MKYTLYYVTLIGLLLVLASVSCRRDIEIASWDGDVMTPLAHGELNLTDLVDEEELTSDDSNLLRVGLRDTLINLGLDSLVSIPDTTLEDAFILPFGNITLNPGVPFYDSSTVTRYALGEIQLTYLEVRKSLFRVNMENLTNTQILIQYRIPSATDANGDTFRLDRLIPAKSSLEETFNLDAYRLNLRGRRNASFNTLISEVTVMVDPALTGTYNFTAGEGFRVENTIEEIIPQYARGYFGAEQSTYADASAFDLLNEIRYDRIDITDFRVEMLLDNGVGADLGLNIRSLGSRNTNDGAEAQLQHEVINNAQQLSRAIYLGDDSDPLVKHIQQRIVFDQTNSNLDELIELNPTELFYDLDIDINPLGNISLGNDFVVFGHDLTATMDVDIPIKLGLEGLVLADTFAFLFEESNPEQGTGLINQGFLRLYVENEYPLDAEVQLTVLDENNVPLIELFDTPQRILAAEVDAQGKAIGFTASTVEMPVNGEVIDALKQGRSIRMEAHIDSYEQQVIQLYDNHNIRFSLVADLNMNRP